MQISSSCASCYVIIYCLHLSILRIHKFRFILVVFSRCQFRTAARADLVSNQVFSFLFFALFGIVVFSVYKFKFVFTYSAFFLVLSESLR